MSIITPEKCVGMCSDHAGFELKNKLKALLESRGIKVKDCGTYSEESCD